MTKWTRAARPIVLQALGIIAGCLSTGCDAGKSGTQCIRISTTPVASMKQTRVRVTCAPTDRDMGPSTLRSLTVDEYLDLMPDSLSSASDETGTATLAFRVSEARAAIPVLLGLERITLVDRVTGREFYCRVESDLRETLILEMLPGQTASGDHFTLRVIDIGQPIEDR